jgi:hypothetical protein
MNLFETARMKLERASKHLDEVSAQAREHNFARWESGVDPTEQALYVRFHTQYPVDPRWGLAIGDAVHNMRTALDYAIADAVRAAGNRATRYNFFPVALDEKEWAAVHSTECRFRDWSPPLQGTSETVRRFVEDRQPYVGRDRHEAEQTALVVVRRMDNADKHRALHTAVLYRSDDPPDRHIIVKNTTSCVLPTHRGMLAPRR